MNKTPSAEILIRVKIKAIKSSELLPYENKTVFEKLCSACPTYGKKWSCPPYSPSYSNIGPTEYPYALLVLFQCDLDQFRYVKTEYTKIKAADSILKSRLDRFMRNLEASIGGRMLSNGTCRLCRPCSGKSGLACKKPEMMRFSMEALGLDVGRITADILGHSLLWYKDGKAPEYLSAAACLLMKEPYQEHDLEAYIL